MSTYHVYLFKVNTQEPTLEEYMVAKVLQTAKVPVEVAAFDEDFNMTTQDDTDNCSLLLSPSASSSEANINESETTLDAMEYISGYIAKKFQKEYPELGDKTYKIKISDHAYNLPSWVQQLSFGGLIKPYSEFLNTVHKWNKHFEVYHGQNLRKDSLVIKKLVDKIKESESLPCSVVKLFCKLRTIIRMNYINTTTQCNKRKLTYCDSSRKINKKMRKVIN